MIVAGLVSWESTVTDKGAAATRAAIRQFLGWARKEMQEDGDILHAYVVLRTIDHVIAQAVEDRDRALRRQEAVERERNAITIREARGRC